MKDPTTIEDCGLDTRLEARLSGSGNEVVCFHSMGCHKSVLDSSMELNFEDWMDAQAQRREAGAQRRKAEAQERVLKLISQYNDSERKNVLLR
jgi:hypothetical protein